MSRGLTAAGIAMAAWTFGACEEGGTPPPTGIDATGVVQGVLFEDRNGNGIPDGPDRGVAAWPVSIRQPAGGSLGSTATDTAGAFRFTEVPIGSVRLVVDEGLLGDTLELFGVALEAFNLAAEEVKELRPAVRLRSYDVADVRDLPPGRPLFTSGIALNGLTAAVRTLHITTPDGSLRVEGILSGGLQPGDSVLVRGRTARQFGQTYLLEGQPFLLQVTGTIPEAVDVSTREADEADGGDLDAALVQVNAAEILEAELLDDDAVRVVVNDGSGPLEILFRSFLDMDEEDFVPDTIFVDRARGLLVPFEAGGAARWRLEPRTRSDFRLEERDFPEPPPPVDSAAASLRRSRSVAGAQRNR
jgi:hypothetical protein